MRHHTATLLASLLLCLNSMTPAMVAQAAKLSAANSGSTVPQNCDLCWSPSAGDSNRLPSTLQPYRPHHPRSSRPHRRPSGRYKITPYQKQIQPSALRRLLRPRLPYNQPISAVDGDTVRMGGERIRLRGIDTPELNEPGGQEAKQRLETLLHDGPIRIVPYGQDVYGRTVADVFVNGRNVAEVLRQEGFSKPQL
ncbi:MAG: thermonuclease family protein [Nitrospira sp.]|jgi:micrococcal nuclease|nr:thermonuclease family protein [Nitrospira sp.]